MGCLHREIVKISLCVSTRLLQIQANTMVLACSWRLLLDVLCYVWHVAITCLKCYYQMRLLCVLPSTGPDILIFKRFREKWHAMVHHIPTDRSAPLITDHDDLKAFIEEHLKLDYPRDDYRELLCLAASMLGMQTNTQIRKPGALHRARWMAKAIYSLKMELLLDGNEAVLQLSAWEVQGIQRFNRFIIYVYLQSWSTSRIVTNAPINDILLIQRLNEYNDVALQMVGLKMMKRHS